MTIHEFGTDNSDILLILHGSCMLWDMYSETIKQLSQHFHVVIPALPGHDPETKEDFTSVEQIASQMTDWLLRHDYNTVACLYGFSMGGSIVLRMLTDKRVNVCHAIVNGGITPYQLPRLVTRLIAIRDYFMVRLGRSSRKVLTLAFPPEKYTENGVDSMYKALRHMSSKTIWRVFESCNNYSMPDPVPVVRAKMEYWYGENEKKERSWDIEYVKKNFQTVRFREISGMGHGEYCIMHQKDFANDVAAFCMQPATN